MRIVHINTMMLGGAAKAMTRLHEGLLAAGSDSVILTQDGIGGSSAAFRAGLRGKIANQLLHRMDIMPLRLFPRRQASEFNLQWVPGRVLRKLDMLKPDIVHLHWICRSFLRVEDLRRIDCPIVWTMHDSWPFTGGCNVPFECVRYREGCGRCPQLGSSILHDLSWWLWRRKSKAWRNVAMTAVSPSRWLGTCAASSPLLAGKALRVIPNGLDLEAFQPFDKRQARRALRLPQDKTLLLFGGVMATANRNKGFQFIKPALEETSRHIEPSNLELVVVGEAASRDSTDIGIPVRFIGALQDNVSMGLLYSAVDATVLPSLQESFGLMAAESLACGIPVVAFNATGFRDIVEHGVNGYLAAPYDAAALGAGIADVLTHSDKAAMSQAARDKATREYGQDRMAERYAAIYKELSASQGKAPCAS